MKKFFGVKTTLAWAMSALMLSGCGGGGSSTQSNLSPTPSTTKEWTYMVYMAADNNLSESAVDDVNEMEQVGSSDQVNVVVQADFSPQYSVLTSPNTQRGLIKKDNNTQSISSLSSMGTNVDMGNPQSLVDFVQWAKTNYPAKNYALVLWSHGDGWKTIRSTGGIQKGALQDETAGSYMSFANISSALSQVGDLALINFDACLMGMYEVAYQLRQRAQVLVASPEVEPGDGDPYNLILGDLIKTPSMSAKTLGQTIVSHYSQSYLDQRDTTTKAVYDLAQMGAVHTAMTDLSDWLKVNFEQERLNVQLAQQAALAFDQPGHLDLGSFLYALANTTTDTTLKAKIAAVQAAIAASTQLGLNNTAQADSRYQHATGMGIYLPTASQTSDEDLTLYQNLAINTPAAGWGNVIHLLLDGQTQSLPQTEGNFAFRLVWNDPNADLDLIVVEPDRTLHAAWEGTTTPNGFFSAESADSGRPEESYTAASRVDSGSYDVLVNYYSNQTCGLLCQPISANLWVKEQGATTFVNQDTITLDFSQPSDIDADVIDIVNEIFQAGGTSPYSDWAYSGALVTNNVSNTKSMALLSHKKRLIGRFNSTIRAKRLQGAQ